MRSKRWKLFLAFAAFCLFIFVIWPSQDEHSGGVPDQDGITGIRHKLREALQLNTSKSPTTINPQTPENLPDRTASRSDEDARKHVENFRAMQAEFAKNPPKFAVELPRDYRALPAEQIFIPDDNVDAQFFDAIVSKTIDLQTLSKPDLIDWQNTVAHKRNKLLMEVTQLKMDPKVDKKKLAEAEAKHLTLTVGFMEIEKESFRRFQEFQQSLAH